jgi:hypothetical protein
VLRSSLHLQLHRHAAADRLIDHAVTLGEFEQLVELLWWGVGFDGKGKPYRMEADCNAFVDP